MFKRVFLINLIILFGMFSAYSQKVGLVLSGGGAKGAVHIGVIKALEDNCIPIDYIAGTSIGAIVGSLYAMGYSPEEMLTLFLSEEFNHWQTGKVEEGYQYYFRKKREKPDFISLNIPIKDSLKIRNAILPNSLTNPIQINQAFLHIFSQANAQCNGDFDQLFVPFLCIASDVYNKKAIVFRNGNLGDAVRASMTFPFVFKPILKDSIPLFDGGIYDNFPVEPMKNAWNPDFVIGSSVAGNKKIKPAEQSIYEQMESIVMQKSNYDIGANEGIILKFIPEDVGLLDFHKAEQLYKTGYNTTLAAIDSIKKCIHRRTCLAEVEAKRTAYKASLPNLIFKNIHISGVTKMQKIYIESQIQRDNNNAFTIEDFKRTYFHLLTNPKIKEILPHARYDAENKTFDLFLDIQMSDEITIAFGGNISSMSANQIYLGVGYRSMSKVSSTYSLDMQLGNAYNGVALEGKVEIPNKIPLDISGLLAYNHQQYYESSKLFIDTDVSTFIRQSETFAKIGIGMPFRTKAKIDLMVAYGILDDQYYRDKRRTFHEAAFDYSRYNLFCGGIYYTKNSLNTKQYPVSGHNHHLFAQFVSGRETFKPPGNGTGVKNNQSYIQIKASLNNYHVVARRFNFGYNIEGVVSSKNLWSNYTASVLQAPAYTPTPHSKLVFNEAFRANQYLAGGITPIWKLNSTIHFRGDLDVFVPVYPIMRGDVNAAIYGKTFTKPAYLGEISLVAQLPFMSISLFVNHYSYPTGNWNMGLNIGYLIFGTKFIR